MAEVKVYTTDYCPYCRRAKDLLNRKGVPFTEIDVTSDDELRAKLVEWTGMRTVPQIFINGKPYGGYDDIAALDQKGELDKLLAG